MRLLVPAALVASLLAAGCGGSDKSTSGTAPLEGSWEMTVTHPAGEAGTYRLSIHDGRFESSVKGGGGLSRDSGSIRFARDIVVFHITGGHDLGDPDWHYRWRLYRGTLTFRRAPARYNPGPSNPTFAPWHRVRAAPVGDALLGVWVTRVTRARLLASRPDYAEDDLRTDAGEFRLALRRRGFSFWHRSLAGGFSFAGVAKVTDDRLALRFTTGDEAGSAIFYRWSVYRGALTLRTIPGKSTWEFMTVTAWRRSR